MRVLCTGITSTHAWPAFCELAKHEHIELFGIKPPKAKLPVGDNIFSVCITDVEKVTEIVNKIKPTHVLHAAGVCDLDACEADPERAEKINVQGTRLLSSLTQDAYFMYCSADLVFSGINPPPGGYKEHHEPDPVSVVGRTLFAAEKEARKHPKWAIIRIGLPMGPSVQGKKGAVDWIESRFKKGKPVTLFFDEFRSATPTDDMGKMIVELFMHEVTGYYHVAGPSTVSLYEMGKTILNYDRYDHSLLTGIYIEEEKDGPPRIYNVALNAEKAINKLGWKPKRWEGK